jgi:hypothetical protein
MRMKRTKRTKKSKKRRRLSGKVDRNLRIQIKEKERRSVQLQLRTNQGASPQAREIDLMLIQSLSHLSYFVSLSQSDLPSLFCLFISI